MPKESQISIMPLLIKALSNAGKQTHELEIGDVRAVKTKIGEVETIVIEQITDGVENNRNDKIPIKYYGGYHDGFVERGIVHGIYSDYLVNHLIQ